MKLKKLMRYFAIPALAFSLPLFSGVGNVGQLNRNNDKGFWLQEEFIGDISNNAYINVAFEQRWGNNYRTFWYHHYQVIGQYDFAPWLKESLCLCCDTPLKTLTFGPGFKEAVFNDPDYTVGIKLEKDKDNIIYVTDLVRLQDSPLGVQTAIRNTASQDGHSVRIGIEQDPGQAGVSEADYLVRMLQGHNVKTIKATKDKVTRALPVSSQAEAGNVKILQAPWNEAFFRELENFPEGTHDDIVDALSGAFLMLSDSKYDLSALTTF